MKIKVLAFGAAADAAGAREWSMNVEPGTNVSAFLREVVAERPALAAIVASLAVAVDFVHATAETILHDGAEVALLPPASGGAEAWLTATALDLDDLIRRVSHVNAGGIVTFTGTVRAKTREGRATRQTALLKYEAYTMMARLEMERIAREAESRWPGARVAMCHRVGDVPPGEASVAVAVSAPHRAQAFDACRFCIDTLKATVPIWKKEVAPDGSEEWSNRP